MPPKRPDGSPIWVFASAAFAGSILLSAAIGLAGGRDGSLIALAPLSMIIPTMAAAIARATTGAHFDLHVQQLPTRWLPAALLTFPLTIHLLAIPAVILLEGRIPWHFPPAWGTPGVTKILFRMSRNAAVGIVIVTVMAFFEEVGWRAFFLRRMLVRYGALRGAIMTSFLYALWHVPYVFGGVQHVENVSGNLVALLYPVGIFGVGLFLAFLWIKTESIWIVSIAHGSLNNWGQFLFKFMQTSGDYDPALFGLVNASLLLVGLLSIIAIHGSQSSSRAPRMNEPSVPLR